LNSLRGLRVWGNPLEEITNDTYEALQRNQNIKLGMEETEYLGVKRFVDNYNLKIVK